MIHHIDGNTLNDEISNLEKMSRPDHGVFHSSGENNYMYGRNHTKETKKRISDLVSKRGGHFGKNNPMYGKKQSEETKNKISKAKTGKKRSEESKKQQSREMRRLRKKQGHVFPTRENEAKALYDAGWSTCAIAKEFGLSQCVVYRAMQRRGWLRSQNK